MIKYEIEVGENYSNSMCHCCDMNSLTGHGFVYKNGDAYAVYYAGWSPSHESKKISLAIAIGEWSEESSYLDRTCIGLEVSDNNEEVLFRVIDPEESPWPKTDLMGEMISREEGLSHDILAEVFKIGEEIVRCHPAIVDYLTSKN